MFMCWYVYRYLSLDKKVSLTLFLLDLAVTLLLINAFWQIFTSLLEISNGLLLMLDLGSDGGSSGLEGSDGGSGGSSPDNESDNGSDGGSTDVPDLGPSQATCTHEVWSEYTNTSQESLDNATCALNPDYMPDGSLQSHLAFNHGNPAYICSSCHMVACEECLTPNYSSDEYLYDTPPANDNNSDSDW